MIQQLINSYIITSNAIDMKILIIKYFIFFTYFNSQKFFSRQFYIYSKRIFIHLQIIFDVNHLSNSDEDKKKKKEEHFTIDKSMRNCLIC